MPTADWMYWAGYGVVEILGILAAGKAIMQTRSSQGAIAWAMSLVMLPLMTLPLFAIFGRDSFRGYSRAQQAHNLRFRKIWQDFKESIPRAYESDHERETLFERLGQVPFTGGNHLELLIDGEAMFEALFREIAAARSYVLVQFYIMRNDQVGQRLADLLKKKAAEGVTVYCLFDALGSHSLPDEFINGLRGAGVHFQLFKSTTRKFERIQINFRNHRKHVVVDGQTLLIGGFNIGDEYLGRNPKLGHWRDTHLLVRGPAALEGQLIFVEDWYWATGHVPELTWDAPSKPFGQSLVQVLASGPADQYYTCTLAFLEAIRRANRRIWIATPYFVPNEVLLSVLHLAVLRGIDVRLIVTGKSDNLLTKLAGNSYVAEVVPHGIKVYAYQNGFMHQKVLLVDDELGMVGSVNFDRRSFRLNFESTAITFDDPLLARIEAMLEDDMKNSHPVTKDTLGKVSFSTRFLGRLARLLSPIL